MTMEAATLIADAIHNGAGAIFFGLIAIAIFSS